MGGQLVTALGSVGMSMQTTAGPQPGLAGLTYTPMLAQPLTTKRNDSIYGPQPFRAGHANGTVAVDEIVFVQFGAAGGIAIFAGAA